MAGNQFGFDFYFLNNTNDLLSNINNRLDQHLGVYNLSDEPIVYIQVSFRKMHIKLLSEFIWINLSIYLYMTVLWLEVC